MEWPDLFSSKDNGVNNVLRGLLTSVPSAHAKSPTPSDVDTLGAGPTDIKEARGNLSREKPGPIEIVFSCMLDSFIDHKTTTSRLICQVLFS